MTDSPTNWLDTGILVLVIVVGLAIFYKALKEPIDLMLYHIKNGFIWVGQSLSSATGKTTQVIKYE